MACSNFASMLAKFTRNALTTAPSAPHLMMNGTSRVNLASAACSPSQMMLIWVPCSRAKSNNGYFEDAAAFCFSFVLFLCCDPAALAAVTNDCRPFSAGLQLLTSSESASRAGFRRCTVASMSSLASHACISDASCRMLHMHRNLSNDRQGGAFPMRSLAIFAAWTGVRPARPRDETRGWREGSRQQSLVHLTSITKCGLLLVWGLAKQAPERHVQSVNKQLISGMRKRLKYTYSVLYFHRRDTSKNHSSWLEVLASSCICAFCTGKYTDMKLAKQNKLANAKQNKVANKTS